MLAKYLLSFTQNPKNDILSGLTVALALVPEAVAFAFVAGIDPLVGLYGAFIMGIVTALFGGRPGMISGATGAMAVVMVHLIQKGNEVGLTLAEPLEYLGLQWLFITLLFVGAIQIMAGVFRLGKFVRLIPHPVMMGFVNGLAIVIFLSQLGLFKESRGTVPQWLTGPDLWVMLALVGLTMGIMFGLPKLTKKLPAALIAIIIVACITIFGNLDVSTVGSFIRDGGGSGLKGSLPVFQTQIFTFIDTLTGHWDLILSTAFLLAAVGLIEQIPIAALVGVMFMVVIGTFAWSSFRILHKIPLSDAIVLITVSAVTVWQDLAIAVFVGVIMSALVFAWKSATRIRARKRIKEDGTKVYEIWGPLFFGSTTAFNSKFDVSGDPDSIEVDFIESKISDHSGVEAVRNIANKYLDSGKQIKLTHLSPDCKALLLKWNPEFDTIIEDSIEDPRYYVVTDTLDAEV